MPRTLEQVASPRSATRVAPVTFTELERSAKLRRALRRIGRLLLQAATFIVLVSVFFFRVPQVEGRSMQPTIESGSRVLISTLAYGIALGPWILTSNPIKRGDIVAFDRGDGDDVRTFLKRVVGLPGDSVSLHDGRVSIRGKLMNESYPIYADRSNMKPVVVPAGSVFVLGDNRPESDDSRDFGPVSQASIIGKAIFVMWPVGHANRKL